MSADAPQFPPPAPAARPGRARKILRWAAVGVVAAVAFAALLPTLLSTSAARTAILAWLADNVDRKVEFARLDASWMNGIRLEGLRVADDAGGPPLLEAPLVQLDAPMLPLLWKKVQVRKFVIDGAVVHLGSSGEEKSVVKTKKKRRRGAKEEEQVEDTVLPEIHVPVEVRNLTIVFRNEAGREARQEGISFNGLLNTRDGPTTFDLLVPAGAGGGGGLRVAGEAVVFEPDGTLLPEERRKVDAVVTLRGIDAKTNGDLLALVLGDTPATGVLDGRVATHVLGTDVKGDLDLRLSHLGYGDATKNAAARSGDDLTIAGRFEKTGEKIRIEGWKVRADGLAIDADVAGGLDSLDGKASIDADLARITGALRAIGVDVPGKLAGRLAGKLEFTPSPSKGAGDFALTGFRAEGLVEDRPPVTIDRAAIRFEAAPGKDRFELSSLTITLPDLAASARGTRAADGTLDVSAEAKGDLGGLLARVRDLGFLPGGFAVNGDLDAKVRVSGKPEALVVEVSRLALTEQDARVEVAGTRTASGALDFRASGSGDLGALFGRARAAGAGPQGLETLRGRFAFEARAAGPPSALAVDVPKLHVEGDINVEARAKLAPDGTIDAEVTDVSGKVDDVLLLLRRMALVDREFAVGGTFAATASVRGTREKPEVPRATFKLSGGPLDVDAHGSVAASGALAAEATLTGDLAALADLAQRSGFVAEKPPIAGRITAHAKASGTRDRIDVPEFRVAVANGPADVDASGRYGADGAIAATATVSGDLDRLVRFARDHGWMKRASATGCTFQLRAVASGTKDKIEVPNADFALRGPVRCDVKARMSADRAFDASGNLEGALRPLLELAAAWSGEDAKPVDGTIAADFSAVGRPDKFDARLSRLAVVAQGVRLDAEGTRTGDGAAKGSAKVNGAIADLLSLARAFGVATDVDATGRVEAQVDGSLAGAKAEGSLTCVATDLDVRKPEVGGGPFREPRLAISVPSAKYDLDTKRLEPVKATIEMQGARLVATAQQTGDVLSLEGTLAAQEAFAKNHAEMLSGASFQSLSGPFQFAGDVTKGRENAKDWTGGFTFDAAGVTAPHVDLSTAKFVGKLAGGVLTIDPIDAMLNGGPVKGTASIGLVGESPEHRLVLKGDNVEIKEDLAPLVAHASPLFAVGENGRTGGKASIDMDLAARGFDAASLKKSMTGQGVVGLDNAFVQSTNWLGEVLQFVGASDKLEIGSVKVPFKVHDSKVDTGELPVEAVGLSLRLGGDVGLDGKLDYALRVKTQKGGGLFEKYASLLDKDGYLPLRLGGTIAKPKVKLPDLKDVLTSGLKEGLGGLLGGKKEKDEPKEEEKPKKKKPPKRDDAPPPPPPPPPPTENPPPPPPPPPETPPKKDEPPPKKDEPPPPPPPEDPPPPPPPGEDPPPPPPPK